MAKKKFTNWSQVWPRDRHNRDLAKSALAKIEASRLLDEGEMTVVIYIILSTLHGLDARKRIVEPLKRGAPVRRADVHAFIAADFLRLRETEPSAKRAADEIAIRWGMALRGKRYSTSHVLAVTREYFPDYTSSNQDDIYVYAEAGARFLQKIGSERNTS